MATRHACLILVLSLAMTGCASLKPRDRRPPFTPPPDPVETLRAEEVISKVNRNARLIQTVKADAAVYVDSPQGKASLKGKINFERPKNFHLVLSHMATGKEVDLGSNADGFWFWTKKNPEFYVCNYDATGNIPVETTFQPDWIVESLGLKVIPEDEIAQIDVQEGTGENADTYVLTQRRVTGEGRAYYKQTIVTKSGRIREHKILGPDKALMSRAVIKSYQSMPLSGGETGADVALLPEEFNLYWTEQQMDLRIKLDRDYTQVNTEIALANFERPEFPRFTMVNLRDAMASRDQGLNQIRTTKPPADATGTLAEYDPEADTSRVVRRPKMPAEGPLSRAGSLTGQVVGARYPSAGPDTVAIPFPKSGGN